MRIIAVTVFVFCCLRCFSQSAPAANGLNHVGDTVTISGRIYAGYYLVHVKTKPTFLNVYDSSPSHRLMLRAKFSSPPEVYFLNKNISITGQVENYKGTPLIRVSEPAMIKQIKEEKDTTLQKNIVTANRYIPAASSNPPAAQNNIPDTALQSKWINTVTAQSQQPVVNDVRIVMKEMPLRVNPTNDAPVIADLQPGIAVSILSTSNRWSYVSIKKPNGSGAVYGFIKKRMHKFLRKL